MDSVTGTITRAYDDLDRLTSETTPQGSVSYAYDAANRRTSMTVSNQAEVAYSYDNANRLTQITQGASTVSFAYDNANRRTSLTLPNGVTMSYSYDNASQLTAINYSLGQNSLGNLTYTYDLAGRRTSMGGSLAQVNLPNAISTTAYDAANELTQWGTATPTYDANGNMLSDGTNTYVWNARNQLASMDSGADSFEYGPFGRRVAKTMIFGTTNYLYDGENPVQELSGTTPTANMLTGLGVDQYFTRTDASGTANFLTDALGSTIELTDNSGNSLAQYTYEPFGNTTATGTSSNPYQYTARENDSDGLYFYRARYYSATLQRFISQDPIEFAGGLNPYAYVGDDPVLYYDPHGLDKQQPPQTPPSSKNACQVGPLNLNANIKVAKVLAATFWSGLAPFSAATYYELIKTGGPWDPKTWDGATPENVAAGNINFGATCSQFGFNTSAGGQICQYGAGIYGKLNGNYGSPLFSPFHGDWPSDNMQIRQGLAIAGKGGC